jgi:Domain of unknown function (DUF4304)
MTARERYDAMVRDEIGPWLRERGFKKRRNRFRRADDAGWEIVDFQASQWGSRDRVRFTINLWVGVPELDESDSRIDPHVEQRLGALIADDGEDVWWSVDADTDVVQLARELRTLLDELGLPWLERRAGLERLLLLAEQHPDEFPSYLLRRFAMLLGQAGMADEAARIHRLG